MTTEQVFRDATDIFGRLFNHRAALQGLNQNFVREFGSQEEMMALSSCLERADNCTQCLYPATQEGFQAHIHQLREAVTNTSWACHRILLAGNEKKFDWLEQRRAQRSQEWEEFIQGQAQERVQHADREFEVRADGLQRHYADLEERLKQGALGRLL